MGKHPSRFAIQRDRGHETRMVPRDARNVETPEDFVLRPELTDGEEAQLAARFTGLDFKPPHVS